MSSISEAAQLLANINADNEPTENTFIHAVVTTIDTTSNGVFVAMEGDLDSAGNPIESDIAFPILGSYNPVVNDRVLMAQVKETWVILGDLQNLSYPPGAEIDYDFSTTPQNVSNGALNWITFATLSFTLAVATKVRIDASALIQPNNTFTGAHLSNIWVDGVEDLTSRSNIVMGASVSASYREYHRPMCRQILNAGAHTVELKAARNAAGSGTNDQVIYCQLQAIAC